MPLNDSERESLSVEINILDEADAPVTGGEKAGEMIFKDGDGKEIAVCDVVFEYDIDKKDLKTTAQMLIKYWINPQKSYILKYNA